MKDGLSVRGLTTAASLWITAAIGILVGIGLFFPVVLATTLTLGTLSLFRWIETQMPAEFYAQLIVRFSRERALPETEMRRMLKEHGFTVGTLSYRIDFDANFFEYLMVIRSRRDHNTRRIADAIGKLEGVREFRIVPTGN